MLLTKITCLETVFKNRPLQFGNLPKFHTNSYILLNYTSKIITYMFESESLNTINKSVVTNTIQMFE